MIVINNKKMLVLFLSVIFVFSIFAGCDFGSDDEEAPQVAKLRIRNSTYSHNSFSITVGSQNYGTVSYGTTTATKDFSIMRYDIYINGSYKTYIQFYRPGTFELIIYDDNLTDASDASIIEY